MAQVNLPCPICGTYLLQKKCHRCGWPEIQPVVGRMVITNLKRDTVSIYKYMDGSVEMVTVPRDDAMLGTMRYDPATNETFVRTANGWERATLQVQSTTPPRKLAPLKKTGISILGVPVYTSESINPDEIMVVGKEIHLNPGTAQRADNAIMHGGGERELLDELVKAAQQAKNSSYTIDPSMLKRMQRP